MRTYFNPEMNIASFDSEAVGATNASDALATWQSQAADGATKYRATVDFQNMTTVNVEF